MGWTPSVVITDGPDINATPVGPTSITWAIAGREGASTSAAPAKANRNKLERSPRRQANALGKSPSTSPSRKSVSFDTDFPHKINPRANVDERRLSEYLWGKEGAALPGAGIMGRYSAQLEVSGEIKPGLQGCVELAPTMTHHLRFERHAYRDRVSRLTVSPAAKSALGHVRSASLKGRRGALALG